MNNETKIPITAFTDFICREPQKVINIHTTEKVLVCDSVVFIPVVGIMTYKGFQSNNQLVIAQKPFFKCVKCGAIHDLDKQDSAHGGRSLNNL